MIELSVFLLRHPRPHIVAGDFTVGSHPPGQQLALLLQLACALAGSRDYTFTRRENGSEFLFATEDDAVRFAEALKAEKRPSAIDRSSVHEFHFDSGTVERIDTVVRAAQRRPAPDVSP